MIIIALFYVRILFQERTQKSITNTSDTDNTDEEDQTQNMEKKTVKKNQYESGGVSRKQVWSNYTNYSNRNMWLI